MGRTNDRVGRIRGLVAVGAVAALLAACSDGATTPDGTVPEESPGGNGDAQAVTLQVWFTEASDDYMDRLQAAYAEHSPHVTLEFTEFPEADYNTKIDTAIAAGQPPDVALVFEPRWIRSGAIAPLDDAVEAAGIDVSNFSAGSLSAMSCIQEGTLYCLGSYQGAVVLFYNKDLFDAVGEPYPPTTEPMTIDEYAAVAERLTVPSSNIVETVWGGAAPPAYWWTDQRTMFSEDGRTVQLVDGDTVAMYSTLAQMVIDGSAPSPSFLDNLGSQMDNTDLMAQGLQAMVFSDNNYGANVLEAAGIRYGAAPVPVESASQEAWVPSWTDSWGAFAASPRLGAAIEFVLFIATVGNDLRVEVAGIPLDSSRATYDDWAQGVEGREEILEVLGLSRSGIFVPGFWDVVAPLEDVIPMVVDDGWDAREALESVAPSLQSTLDLNWETWEGLAE